MAIFGIVMNTFYKACINCTRYSGILKWQVNVPLTYSNILINNAAFPDIFCHHKEITMVSSQCYLKVNLKYTIGFCLPISIYWSNFIAFFFNLFVYDYQRPIHTILRRYLSSVATVVRGSILRVLPVLSMRAVSPDALSRRNLSLLVRTYTQVAQVQIIFI